VIEASVAPPPPALAGPVLHVCLDVHSDSIAVSLAPSESTEVRRYGLIGGSHDDVLRLIKQLAAAHTGVVLELKLRNQPAKIRLCPMLPACRDARDERGEEETEMTEGLAQRNEVPEFSFLCPNSSVKIDFVALGVCCRRAAWAREGTAGRKSSVPQFNAVENGQKENRKGRLRENKRGLFNKA